MTETSEPLAVRRKVSFSEAVYEGDFVVEGVGASLAHSASDFSHIWNSGKIAVIVDPHCACLPELRPNVLIDAVLAKRNIGTKITDARLVMALGPGFEAGVDCHCLIETDRGHNLGRLVTSGATSVNTGEPGDIMGHTHKRVLRAPAEGTFESYFEIGDLVEKGCVVGSVQSVPVDAQISGVLRGILRTGTHVNHFTKLGDIDPRSVRSNCFTISDKARNISGSALEAILAHMALSLT